MSAHRTLNDISRAFDSGGPGTYEDPGSGKTITFTQWGQVCPVVTTGAEARTLARPTKAGMMGTVVHKTAGGVLTLTVTGGYNNDGDTSITIPATAGLYVAFYSIEYGGAYYWRVAHQEGTNIAIETLSVDSLTVAGTSVVLDSLTMGAGFTSGPGGIAVSSIQKIGSLYKTTIFVDLTGLESSTTDTDIIGLGLSPAHFGQITAAKNGTLFYGQITWLETPAGGADDIDFYSATEGTGVFSGLITDLVEVAMYQKGSAASAAAATQIALSALPAADKYMYAACGEAGTAGTYTAGQFLMELWGS